ncbi:unnamed protein product [Lactuca saligna]|uniref:Myb/SANT-like domain-containing protein n=1 Tax=Lactuca saligna TaxID=75948 RepID=A0AA35YA20_LACSI|nr:unnamed protein product [Lactuca saligna]
MQQIWAVLLSEVRTVRNLAIVRNVYISFDAFSYIQWIPEAKLNKPILAKNFRDAKNEESDSSSDDPTPERNEEETSKELQPVAKKKCNYTHRLKRKKWVEREELALARAYIDVSKDKQCGNQQRFDAFGERVLEHFNVQMGGLDLSRHQVNSKWKDLQKKCNAFNDIYNCKMNSVASGRSKADVLQSSLSEYRRTINQKGFPRQQAWE